MNSSVSRAEAAQELLRRRDARQSLISFTEYTYPQYRAAAHHRLVADKLEAVARGEIDRLMIFQPPRHGKSRLASIQFPAWYLGKYPDRSIIAASYNIDLASDFGRATRDLISSRRYANIFPGIALAPDSQAATRWHTNREGAYIAAGCGTAVTGRGAHVFLIDDPVKDRMDADSEVMRARNWDWYTSTVYSRLEDEIAEPGEEGGYEGAVIVIQTRWHEDDLAGRLLEQMDKGGDEWEVIDLPALAVEDDPLGREPGEALWPEKYGIDRLERTRSVVGSRDWSALFQQRPAPEEGALFQRAWFRWYDEKPKDLRTFGASDFAVTADGGDFTVHGIAGLDADDNLYLLDWWRGQTASDIWIEQMLDLASVWKPTAWAVEKGQIEKSIGPFLTKRMRERRVYINQQLFASTRDKAVRAQSIIGRAAMGKIYLPTNAAWSDELVSELLRFPYGKTDDQVDVLSLFGRMLDSMMGKRPQPVAERKPRDRYAEAQARQKRKASTSWAA